MLAMLAEAVTEIHFSPINSPRSTPTEELQAALPSEIQIKSNQQANLQEALAACQDSPLVLITGSAFLVGEAKAFLASQNHRSTEQ